MGIAGRIFRKRHVRRAGIVTTFVSVGNANQPFSRLIEAVAAIAPKLPQNVVVQHGHTPLPAVAGCIAMPFVEMEEFSRYVAEADLLILHAGAGSVIHAVQAGKVPVVMPRRAQYGEHVDDHQLEFARALAGAGKVVIVEEEVCLLDAATEAMKRQDVARPAAANTRMVSLIGEALREHAQRAAR